MQSFNMKFLGVTTLQGVEFPIFLLIFAWALQQCSANALSVIIWGTLPYAEFSSLYDYAPTLRPQICENAHQVTGFWFFLPPTAMTPAPTSYAQYKIQYSSQHKFRQRPDAVMCWNKFTKLSDEITTH